MAELYVPGSATEKDATAMNSTDDQLKEDAEKVPQEVETAFVVFLDDDGQWIGASDLTLVKPRRPASLHDMFAGAVSIADDVSANKTAQHVHAMMVAQAKAMQQQMSQQAQAQNVLQRIQQQGGFKGH